MWWEAARSVQLLATQRKLGKLNYSVDSMRDIMSTVMAVVLFTPSEWGEGSKKRGIYEAHMKEKYNWDAEVPFGPVNANMRRDGKVIRKLKKPEMMSMLNYLLKRYRG